MQYLQRSTKQEVLQLERNWQRYFTLCVEKKPSTYANGKGILKSVTIIGASLYCHLLGRTLQESSWTDWMNTLNSQGFYQKAKVNSGKTEEQLTWSSQQVSFKRNARNRMWITTRPVDLIEALDRVSREGLWKIMTKFGLIHSNGAAVPRWYACKGPNWWWVFWSIPCDKWC